MLWKRLKKTQHSEETKIGCLSLYINSKEFGLSFTNRVEGVPWFATLSKIAIVIAKVEFLG